MSEAQRSRSRGSAAGSVRIGNSTLSVKLTVGALILVG